MGFGARPGKRGVARGRRIGMVAAMGERLGFYEFFAGGGMARAGLGEGWECLFANDFDAKKAASYRENWGDKELYVGDVASVNPSQLPSHADLAWASFPCQDLSLAGNGAGLKGERSSSFWPFWQLIQTLRLEGRAPKTIVLENVCGLLTSHRGKDFAEICQAISAENYLVGAVVIDAAYFVPQSRRRLFIIAICDDRDLPHHLTVTEPSRWCHPARLCEAYLHLPETVRSRWLWFNLQVPPRSKARLAEIVEKEPDGVVWDSPTATDRLLSMMNAVNQKKVATAVKDGRRIVGAVYKRMRLESGFNRQRAEARFDGIAGCLRTPLGGSSRQGILIAENGVVRTRLLSPRELARLTGLPKKYELPDRYNATCRLTGDGVVVPVVKWIAGCVLEPVLSFQSATYQVAAE